VGIKFAKFFLDVARSDLRRLHSVLHPSSDFAGDNHCAFVILGLDPRIHAVTLMENTGAGETALVLHRRKIA
jgi:hypothetical protein